MRVTYHVVVPFDRGAKGDLKPSMALKFRHARAAERTACALAAQHAGAVAFSRTDDSVTGKLGEPMVLGVFGEVDLDAL